MDEEDKLEMDHNCGQVRAVRNRPGVGEYRQDQRDCMRTLNEKGELYKC